MSANLYLFVFRLHCGGATTPTFLHSRVSERGYVFVQNNVLKPSTSVNSNVGNGPVWCHLLKDRVGLSEPHILGKFVDLLYCCFESVVRHGAAFS